MRFVAVLTLTIVGLLGCHKKQADSAAQNPDLGTPVAMTPGKPAEQLPPPPAKITANADNYVRQNVNGTVDPNLTTQLRTFVQTYGRLPQSFTEFANRGLDSMPHPPEGTKWVIDAPNQQVKAVSVK